VTSAKAADLPVFSTEEFAALRQFHEAYRALRTATKASLVAEAIATMNEAEEALALLENGKRGVPLRRRVAIVDLSDATPMERL
jgi:hypothetical protein